MKYLIVDTKKSYSVAVDSDGRFMNVLNQNHRQGQYVNEVIPIEGIGKKEKKSYKGFTAVASAAACILVAFLATTMYMPDSYGSVYITINPEVRLDVSEKGKVVGLEALNEDGVKVTEGVKWRKRDALVVTDEIMDNALRLGLIQENGNINVDIDTDDDVWFSDMGLKFRTNLDEYMKDKASTTVQVKRYGEEDKAVPEKEKADKEKSSKKKSTSSGSPSNGTQDNSSTESDNKKKNTTQKKTTPSKSSTPTQTDDSDYDSNDDSNYETNDDSNFDGSDDSSDDSNYDG